MNNKSTMKKLLTLEDLVNFCELNKLSTFSSTETGYKLVVQVPAQFEINKEQNDNSLLFCLVKLMHSGENRNHSSVTDDALIKASKTLAYKPILANFMEYTDPDTNETLVDFTSHDMEITKDGIIYYEHQIGCFTSDEPYFEIEEETGHNFLYGYCAIPREYTAATSIIERKNGTKVSVELEINEMQYSVTNKVLELTDVNILGATCLGKDPETLEDVGEGMKNARLDIADFSQENNSIIHYSKEDRDLHSKLIETLDALNVTLSKFNINDSNESKETYRKEDIEEVGEKDIMLNEEVEETAEVTEVVETEENEVSEKVEETVEENSEESTEEEETEAEESETPVEDETPEVVETETEESENKDEETVVEEENKFALVEKSFEIDGKKFSVSFELSHGDIKCGLYNLLSQYEESDNDWYYIREVYDDKFTYQGYFSGKIYGQKYAKDGDNISFDGERWELFEELLTASEKAELESMRSNYSLLQQFKVDTENAQLHAQRESILNNEKYAVLAEKDDNNEYKNEAYAKLVSEMDNYSLADLEKELKSVFADYITNGGQFAYAGESTVKPIVSKKLFATSTGKKASRYGNLFNNDKK